MRHFRLLVVAVMLTAFFALSVSAQTRPTGAPASPAPQPTPPIADNGPVPASKIAYIDTEYFSDEKTGITKYVNVVKALEREFQPRQTELNTMQARLKTLADEIAKLSETSVVDPKTIQAKQEEGERIQIELKRKKEDADAAFTKRYQEVVNPVSKDIYNALKRFSAERGLTMILDISKLSGAVLISVPGMDVTQAFINYYNASATSVTP